ncbi:Zinc finger CCCH domain-containing protein 55 [Camellia lanceoleosa]|uniref:Zinc finger CCCH domain-containing protein 55 n=1 Tax=Camellia lanceoleosa TaxID=1840588 RepID=A0ACC0I707_9ERIC|nr:Zinc finger CCCH domain-containing protein 55 [Camellia lanceoleosa]
MYGQGNFSPQFGQGSHTPMPPFQQRPVVPPPPPFQKGHPTLQHSTIQQGPPSIPPCAGYSGSFVYRHAPPPTVQQGQPVHGPTSEMLNAGQSYLPPPPPPPPPQQIYGNTSMTHSYPTAQQNSQWTQNMHHVPPPVPPPLVPRPTGPSPPEMFLPSISPREIPTLTSLGQTSYRGPIHLPQPGNVQGTQQIPLPLPPPPPTSSFFTPAPFGSFVHSAHQDSNVLAMGPMPPPPPPSSPPPPPPSPPPPTSPHPSFGSLSSTPPFVASDLSHNSKSGPMSNRSGFEVMASNSVDEVVAITQIRDDAPLCNDYKNFEGRTICEMGSPLEVMNLDLPPPPLKPAEQKVVQRIEVLCNFIANNGPGFEDTSRQKECGNPEFEFLFGGEPGSEAAVAHEYFEWMKKKCILACKLQHKHSNSVLRPSDMDTSKQINCLMGAGVPHSPSDSDMDMEDDITQPDEEQRVYNSFEGLNHESVLIPKELDIPEQLSAPHNSIEHCLAKDALSRSSGLAEQEKGSKLFRDHDHFTYGRSVFKVDSSVTVSSVPAPEDLSQSNASAAAVGFGSEKFPSELIKGASPFRLLQDYASDDSSEDDVKPCLEEVGPVTASISTTAGATSLNGEILSNLQMDQGLMSVSSSEMAFGTFSESVVACSVSMSPNALKFSTESQRTAREADVTSIATVKTEELVENNSRNQESIDNAVSPEVLQLKDTVDGVLDAAPDSGKSHSQKEDFKYASTLPKVDEFGRLVREGASDSDSEDPHYTRRRGKRGRSWSQSQSPHDRRRRRSPRRGKEKRSRSRSLSPKKRRSRSRSPSYGHGGEFVGHKMRWDKGQLPECLDFLRGRCHRGAFCRYFHPDSNKKNSGSRNRSKQQYVEVPTVSRTSDFHEEIDKTPPKRSVHQKDMPGDSVGVLRDGKLDREQVLVSVQDAVQTIISDRDDKSLITDVLSERSIEVTAIMQQTQIIKEEILESSTLLPDNQNCLEIMGTVHPVVGSPSRLTDAGAPKSPGDTTCGVASSIEKLVMPQSQANPSLPVLHNADHRPHHVDGSSTSDSSPLQMSSTLQSQLPVSEPLLNKISSVQSYPGTSSISQSFLFSSLSGPPKDLTPSIIPAVDFLDHSSLSQGKSTSPPQLPGEMMQQTSKFPSFSPPVENYPPSQTPMQNQHSDFVTPPNSWSLPPPPPLLPFVNNSTVTAATAMQGVPSLQSHQNQLPPRNDFISQTFVRHYPPELPAHSQVGEFQHRRYSLMQEQGPTRPLSHMEDFRRNPLPMGNPMSQPFGDTGLVGDHFSRFPLQGLNPPNSFAQGNIPLPPVSSLRDSAGRRMQSFSGDDLPSVEFSTSSSHLQQQRPLYGLQRSAADGISVNQGEFGNVNFTMSRYTSDILDRNQPSYLSDFGGSRISNYYNPYASTFDQPLSSKFSSNVFKQEKDLPYSNLHDASLSLSHVPVDGQGIGSLGSRHMTSLPKSAQAADLPRPGSDQYDPLFDSIEPSSNSFNKFDHVQRRETTLRLSGSHKPLDVEENNKQKEVEAVAVSTSIKSENDEYGETADAEVGDVDNASASSPLDEANTTGGEIEIDQVKLPGKSKKSKDSRSMKLFKVALADFVKEVLKPSWRQGNMSKEAFKTIVKKTVDKVSGAMKSHHIPKSQAKINRYIDSSQRKLTKLVTGYVQKYAKG